jgi:hypothetical protein
MFAKDQTKPSPEGVDGYVFIAPYNAHYLKREVPAFDTDMSTLSVDDALFIQIREGISVIPLWGKYIPIGEA